MLNMGFIDEVEEILTHTKVNKNMLMFSATIPKRIHSLAKKYMKDYEQISISSNEITTPLIDQIYFEVSEADKFEALTRIIDIEIEFYGMVFCRTKVDTDNLASKLNDYGYDAEALHGDLSQSQRENILNSFKAKRINILIATDVAA